MEPTLTASHPLGVKEDRTCWVVTVANGPQVGARRELRAGESLELGRGSTALGQTPLQDAKASRRHLRIEVDPTGRASLSDLGSRNGTFVNGVRVQTLELSSPQVVCLGHTALVIDRQAPASTRPVPEALRDVAIGVSAVFRDALISLGDGMARPGPVLLLGEAGVGKTFIAETTAERLRPDHRRVVVDCARLEPGELARRVDAIEPPAVVLLERVDALPAEHHSALERLLADPRSRTDLLATSTRELEGEGLPPQLRHRLGRWPIVLPPLRERPSDLGLLAHALAARHLGRPRPLDPDLVLRLLTRDWPGNLHELEALVERCVASASEDPDEPIGVAPGAWAMLAPSPPPPAEGPREDLPRLIVHEDGAWFRLGDAEPVSLRPRSPAARTLAVLARRAADGLVSVDDLVEQVWPHEPLVGRSGRNRLYVALTALRKAGLAALIERAADGYRLTGVGVVRSPSAEPV